ncbi:RHS repeat-associated core domain-containing protein, partial [Elizabethkingia anophelis]
TDYLDGFQYENGVLQFVPTSEGYYDVVKNKYIYNYTDHLGNVRLSYMKGASGGAEIIEENNYYPFGLKHQGYNSNSLANSAYQYKYNGKELQETGMYDYGARMYMPELGRWGVVDPLAEKMTRHSPYNYAFNNPIRFIDPDGRAATPPDDHFNQFGQFLYTDNKKTNNIIVHTVFGKTREENIQLAKLQAPWQGTQLKDMVFNESNFSTLDNIAKYYAKDAGVDIGNLKNNSFSAGIFNVTGISAGSEDGDAVIPINGGTYYRDQMGESLSHTSVENKTVSFSLKNGQVNEYLNDKFNLISNLGHEAGKKGHLLNPNKEHYKVYEDQMKAPLYQNTTKAYKQHIKENYDIYKPKNSK